MYNTRENLKETNEFSSISIFSFDLLYNSPPNNELLLKNSLLEQIYF